MHLIGPLVAGIGGAALGTAELYKRGTSARADWRTTFEAGAGTTNSTGDDIQLDSNGGAVVYVDELVNVVVKDASGLPVREFVAGVGDSSVEVISPSFTGVDYITGQSGTNKPTTLESVLDKWIASAGATDFFVDVAGNDISIQNALAGTALFVNVKAPQFGAVGDGVEDDTAAIQAAIDFAFANSFGTVFFPPGTYLITDVLVLARGVNLLGTQVSSGTNELKSVIRRSTSSFSMIGLDALANGEHRIERLVLQDASSGTSQTMITVPNNSTLTMHSCIVHESTGGGVGSNSPIFSDDGGTLKLYDCTFSIRGGAGRVARRSGTGLSFATTMVGCSTFWLGTVAFTTAGYTGICRFINCVFEVLCTTGEQPAFLIDAYGGTVVVGNVFSSSLTPPDSCIYVRSDGSAGGATSNTIVEYGNQLGAIFVPSCPNTGQMIAGSRMGRRASYTIAAPGTIAIDGDSFETISIVGSGAAGTYTIDISNPATATPPESTLMLIYRNTSANTHDIDFTADTSPLDTAVAVATGLILRVIYKSSVIGGSAKWWRMTGFTVAAL